MCFIGFLAKIFIFAIVNNNVYSSKIDIMFNNIFLLFNLGTGEILIIVFVVLLLFGGKKIPELMRGLGKGVRSFKEGMQDIKNEIERPVSNEPNKSDSSAADTKKDSFRQYFCIAQIEHCPKDRFG